MLQNKDIKNLSELKMTFVRKHKKSDYFIKCIETLKIWKYHSIFSLVNYPWARHETFVRKKQYSLRQYLEHSNLDYRVKQKGISSLLLIRILISFPFIEQKSVHGFTLSYSPPNAT